MTDNEETRSYNELQTAFEQLTKANEKLAQSVATLKAAARNRSRPYQTAGQVTAMAESEKMLAKLVHEATCDVLMAYIPAKVYHQIEEAGLLRQALVEAIEAWKAWKAVND